MTGFKYYGARRVSSLFSEKLDPHQVLMDEIGPAYAEYRRRWDEARTFKAQPPFPIHVDYELMFRCNLSCPMCLMSLPPKERARYGQAEAELSADQVKDLISQGAALGQASAGFGGLWEPLLCRDLPDIVSHARSKGLVDVMFNTNGLLLDEEMSRRLLDSGLTRLMISLDAVTPEIYGRMRPGGDLRAVNDNIVRFLALRKKSGRRLPVVRLSFCRTAINEHELPEFIRQWSWQVDFFSVQNYGRFPTKVPPDFPCQRAAPSPSGRCPQPHKRLLVRHSGRVLPCCDASGLPLEIGDVHRQGLAEIWAGRQMAELRRALSESRPPKACQECFDKFEA